MSIWSRQPPKTKRPMPRTREAWEREIRGIHRFLQSYRALQAKGKVTWGAKIADYYDVRLRDLLDHPPHKPD